MRLRRGFALAAAAMLAVVSLPGSTTGLGEAVAKVATPGSSDYRHFSSLDKAARRFGASDAQINTVAKSVKTLGLQFAADPTRLFGRVSGSTQQWQTALGTPLSKQAATASSPFITYTLPAQTPAALQPSGTSLLLPQTLVYDPTAEGNRPPNGMRPTLSPGAASTATPTKAARPFPFNTGTPLAANCSSPLLAQRRVYAQQQVQTAYGIDTLRAHAAGTPVITVLDLGGGWLANDLSWRGNASDTPHPTSPRPRATASPPPSAMPTTRPPWICRPPRRWPPGHSCGWCRAPSTASLTGSAGRWAILVASPTSSRCPSAAARSPRTRACPPTPPRSTRRWRACPRSWRRATPDRPPAGPACPGPRCRTRRCHPSSLRSAAPGSPWARGTPAWPRRCGTTRCSASVGPVAAGWPGGNRGRPTRTARTRRTTAPSPTSAR